MTTTTESVVSDTLTITRPEGISDAHWGVLASVAELVVTGHAPWCNDHHTDPDDPSEGYCRRRMETWAGKVTADISNGTNNGHALIGVDFDTEGFSELTPGDALAIGHILIEAAQLARMGNLCVEDAGELS